MVAAGLQPGKEGERAVSLSAFPFFQASNNGMNVKCTKLSPCKLIMGPLEDP